MSGTGAGHQPATGRLRDTAVRRQATQLSVVAGLVCATYGIGARSLLAPTRQCQPVAWARQVAVYLAHVGLGITLSATAAWFGRDPSTASHACRTVELARDQRHVDLALARLEQALCTWRDADLFGEEA